MPKKYPKQQNDDSVKLINPAQRPWISHLLAIIALVSISIIYFFPQLEGKRVMQGDILQWEGMAQEALEYEKKTGEIALWTNSMFSGMPTYQINNYQPNNKIRYLQRAAELFFKDPIGLFVSASLWTYLMLILLGVSPIFAVFGAFSFAFASYHVILYEAGHFLKLQSIGTFPVIASGLILIFRKKMWLGFALFSIGLSLAMYANHIQMTYFLAIVLGIYFIGESVKLFKERAIKPWILNVVLLVLASILALGSGASKLMTSYEYSRDTMRGAPILQPGNDPGSSSETEGLAWEYAMQWSQGPLELLTAIIPGIVGGSSSEKLGPNTALRKELRSRGVNLPPDFKVPLYWGSLPFTSGPVYFGILVFWFFILGLILEKRPIKWFILAGVVFTFIFSLGKNFEVVNRVIFDYLPLMNKFRSPNSITAVTPILLIYLGALAAKGIFSGNYEKDHLMQAILRSGGILVGICLLIGLAGGLLFDFTGASDSQLEQAGFPMQAVYDDRSAMMRNDALRSAIFLLLGMGIIWLYVKGRLKSTWAMLGILLIGVIDLWGVNKRYLSSADFVTQRQYDSYYTPRPVDELIRKDVDPHYRVFDLSVNTFNSSFTSYFHKSIGGYHAAKLQRYQDIIDRHITKNNLNVLNMLNAKYFILSENTADGQKTEVSRLNMEALGHAWLVNEVKYVNTPDEEIDFLGDELFDPERVAVVHREFEEYLSGKEQFSGEGNIRLDQYTPNAISYTYESPDEQLAVFSEVWYGPNKGWNAYINGQLVEHIRVNYVLRALKLPAGKHSIQFKFEPKSFYQGERISLISSILVLLLGIGAVFFEWKENKKIA